MELYLLDVCRREKEGKKCVAFSQNIDQLWPGRVSSGMMRAQKARRAIATFPTSYVFWVCLLRHQANFVSINSWT